MLRVGRAKRKRYTILQGRANLKNESPGLPSPDERWTYVSTGGFSSISFVLHVADIEPIRELHASTFRVGKKEIKALHALNQMGRLDRCTFILSGLADTDKSYDGMEVLKRICALHDWNIHAVRNHSKVILMRTDTRHLGLETSSNLNENPKIEQFGFEDDHELYEFYRKALFDHANT